MKDSKPEPVDTIKYWCDYTSEIKSGVVVHWTADKYVLVTPNEVIEVKNKREVFDTQKEAAQEYLNICVKKLQSASTAVANAQEKLLKLEQT